MGDRLTTTEMRRKLGYYFVFFTISLAELALHSTQCGLYRGLPQHQEASLATTDMDRKLEDAMPLFGGGELGSYLTQCSLGRSLPPYQVISWSIQSFGHNRHGPKSGCCRVPFLEGELGPNLTQCWLGRGLPPFQVAWHPDPSSRLATTDMGRKLGMFPLFCVCGGGGVN